MNHFIHIHDTMKFDLCCNEAKKQTNKKKHNADFTISDTKLFL